MTFQHSRSRLIKSPRDTTERGWADFLDESPRDGPGSPSRRETPYQSTVLTRASSNHSTQRQKLVDLIDRPSSRTRERMMIDIRSKPSMTMKAVTVTTSQGRKEFESLFLGGLGRISVLDMSNIFYI